MSQYDNFCAGESSKSSKFSKKKYHVGTSSSMVLDRDSLVRYPTMARIPVSSAMSPPRNISHARSKTTSRIRQLLSLQPVVLFAKFSPLFPPVDSSDIDTRAHKPSNPIIRKRSASSAGISSKGKGVALDQGFHIVKKNLMSFFKSQSNSSFFSGDIETKEESTSLQQVEGKSTLFLMLMMSIIFPTNFYLPHKFVLI
ncbi:hypothetical protein RIF29_00141 [Crotalaria pallida]|uniref:Uncharacterized protein n=1 Tax=Crotalaria pallida TaxID=3830 RepID=A0AAN9IVD8_CROPI